MTTIYVVYAYGGEYEDKWEKVLKGFRSEEVAERFVLRCEQEHAADSQLRQELEEYVRTWCERNVMPQHPISPKIKKWPAGIRHDQITAEMRAERDLVKAEIEKIDKQAAEIYGAYYLKQKEAKVEFLLAKGLTLDQTHTHVDHWSYREDKHFSYGEVEFDESIG